ncbi:uncharacterized protein [Salminus brasiliensis]|uniref:uncharacterized protein n=1 Tax=Salminus brasiliensis TaxID=930266 RepID=UPI003B82CF01
MNAFEVKLAELVRAHPHLYDRSRRDFKDVQVFANSWREIATELGGDDPIECKTAWSNLRKKFSKARRRMICKSGDEASQDQTPKLYKELSWLNRFVHHRQIPTETGMTLSEKVDTSDPSLDTAMSIKLEQPDGEKEPFQIVCVEAFDSQIRVAKSPSCSSTAESSTSTLRPAQKKKKRRWNTFNLDTAKILCELDKRKADAHDRYAQTIADFMRGLSKRRCAHFRKRINDIMFEMEMEQLQDSGL